MGINQNLWPAREMKTNQNPTLNPSTEDNRSDISQPGNSRFSNFSRENTLYKQCNPEFGAPFLSCCVGYRGSPSSSLVIKTLLFLHRIPVPWWLRKESIHLQCRSPGINPWIGRTMLEKAMAWLPTPVFLLVNSMDRAA